MPSLDDLTTVLDVKNCQLIDYEKIRLLISQVTGDNSSKKIVNKLKDKNIKKILKRCKILGNFDAYHNKTLIYSILKAIEHEAKINCKKSTKEVISFNCKRPSCNKIYSKCKKSHENNDGNIQSWSSFVTKRLSYFKKFNPFENHQNLSTNNNNTNSLKRKFWKNQEDSAQFGSNKTRLASFIPRHSAPPNQEMRFNLLKTTNIKAYNIAARHDNVLLKTDVGDSTNVFQTNMERYHIVSNVNGEIINLTMNNNGPPFGLTKYFGHPEFRSADNVQVDHDETGQKEKYFHKEEIELRKAYLTNTDGPIWASLEPFQLNELQPILYKIPAYISRIPERLTTTSTQTSLFFNCCKGKQEGVEFIQKIQAILGIQFEDLNQNRDEENENDNKETGHTRIDDENGDQFNNLKERILRKIINNDITGNLAGLSNEENPLKIYEICMEQLRMNGIQNEYVYSSSRCAESSTVSRHTSSTNLILTKSLSQLNVVRVKEAEYMEKEEKIGNNADKFANPVLQKSNVCLTLNDLSLHMSSKNQLSENWETTNYEYCPPDFSQQNYNDQSIIESMYMTETNSIDNGSSNDIMTTEKFPTVKSSLAQPPPAAADVKSKRLGRSYSCDHLIRSLHQQKEDDNIVFYYKPTGSLSTMNSVISKNTYSVHMPSVFHQQDQLDQYNNFLDLNQLVNNDISLPPSTLSSERSTMVNNQDVQEREPLQIKLLRASRKIKSVKENDLELHQDIDKSLLLSSTSLLNIHQKGLISRMAFQPDQVEIHRNCYNLAANQKSTMVITKPKCRKHTNCDTLLSLTDTSKINCPETFNCATSQSHLIIPTKENLTKLQLRNSKKSSTKKNLPENKHYRCPKNNTCNKDELKRNFHHCHHNPAQSCSIL